MRTEPLPSYDYEGEPDARQSVRPPVPVEEHAGYAQSSPTRMGWFALGKTVCGASHTRTEHPNEDALSVLPRPEDGYPLVIAIADGVGSERCFRSKTGSRLAVASATYILRQLVAHVDVLAPSPDPPDLFSHRLPIAIARAWEKAVTQHLATHPMTELEQSQLSLAEHRRPAPHDSQLHAYSTTVLAVAITTSAIVYVQLGDGDILTVATSGIVARPLQQDRRLMANETTALGTPDAFLAMRCRVQSLATEPPALIMLTTDGYANSYSTDNDFLQVAADILSSIREDGLVAVDNALESWLTEVSDTGSGDDITAALVYRLDPSAADSDGTL